jgi:hypothetical protein
MNDCDKLECLSLTGRSSLVLTFVGKNGPYLSGMPSKKLTVDKHSSSFCLAVIDEEEKSLITFPPGHLHLFQPELPERLLRIVFQTVRKNGIRPADRIVATAKVESRQQVDVRRLRDATAHRRRQKVKKPTFCQIVLMAPRHFA